MPVTFPTWARVGLAVLVSFLGYLVGGELHVADDLRAVISAVVLLLASVGIVPATSSILTDVSPSVRFLLTGVVTAGAVVVNTVGDIEPTLRGVIVAVLALAASLGIVPPQAK